MSDLLILVDMHLTLDVVWLLTVMIYLLLLRLPVLSHSFVLDYRQYNLGNLLDASALPLWMGSTQWVQVRVSQTLHSNTELILTHALILISLTDSVKFLKPLYRGRILPGLLFVIVSRLRQPTRQILRQPPLFFIHVERVKLVITDFDGLQ